MDKRLNKYQRCANAIKEVLDKYDNGETCENDMEFTQMLLDSAFHSYEPNEYVKISEEAGEELEKVLQTLQVRIEFNVLGAYGFSNVFHGCELSYPDDGGCYVCADRSTRLALEWAYKFITRK